jgi:predicted dehydrogenase
MSSGKLRILVVGAGLIGRRHLEAFRNFDHVELAACEPDLTRRVSVAREFSLSASFGELVDALAHSWDAAVVATPAHTHVAIGRILTDRAIPVLLEKPVSVTTDGVEEWLAAVEARRVPVMVGFVFRCHPLLIAIREALLEGHIGQPVQLIAQRGAHLPARRQDYADTYYARMAEGGGVAQDILSHLYNAAEWLVGPMHRVAADMAHCCLPGVEVDDTVHAIARHGNVLANYSVNQHQRAAVFTLTVNGTHGSLRAQFHDNCWEIATEPEAAWRSHSVGPLTPVEWFERQAKTFLAVVAKKQTPPCSLAEGVATLLAVQATLQAGKQRNGWAEVKRHDFRSLQPI